MMDSASNNEFEMDLSTSSVGQPSGGVAGFGEQARAEAPTFGGYSRRGRRPPKLYRIGEIIDYSGLSRQTIHNYTAMGLIRESRWTPGGHRLYDESVFDRLDKVLTMKRGRKSIREIREYFADQDAL